MNAIVTKHRQQFPDDPRTDEDLTLLYGDEYGDTLTSKFPDFNDEYLKLDQRRRMVNPPGFLEEAGAGIKRGIEGLKTTAYGAGALVAEAVGSSSTREKLLQRAFAAQERASRYAPTVRGVEKIDSLASGAQYAAGAVGEVFPSLVEAAGAALAGGGLGGLLVRGAAKKAGKEAVKSWITKNAAQIGAQVANAANSLALSTGELYSDLSANPDIDPDTAFNVALLGGSIAAVPDTLLPAYVTRKFFKGATTDAAKKAAHGYLIRAATEIGKTVPLEAGTEAFQEFVNLAAEKYADPQANPWTQEDVSRLANAAALGAVGGGVAGPVAAIPSSRVERNVVQTPAGEDAPTVKESLTPEPATIPSPIPEPPRDVVDIGLNYYQPNAQDELELNRLARQELEGLSAEAQERMLEDMTIWKAGKRARYFQIRDQIRRENEAQTQEEPAKPEVADAGSTAASVVPVESVEDLPLRGGSEPATKAVETLQPLTPDATPQIQEQESVPVERVGTDVVLQTERQAGQQPPQEQTEGGQASVGDSVSQPAGQPVAAQIRTPPRYVPIQTRMVPPAADQLLRDIDFEGSRVSRKAVREGRGAATPAYLDLRKISTDDFYNKLLPLIPTSGALGKKSRGMVAFQVGDSDKVLLTNVFEAGRHGERTVRLGYKHQGKNGIEKLMQDHDLRPIAFLTVKTPVQDFAVTYSRPQWEKIEAPAQQRMAELVQSASVEQPAPEEVIAAPGVSVKSRQDIQAETAKSRTAPRNALTKEAAESLVAAVGTPQWTNYEEAQAQFSDALILHPELQRAVWEGFRQKYLTQTATEDATYEAYEKFFARLYESYEINIRRGFKDEALASQVAGDIGTVPKASGSETLSGIDAQHAERIARAKDAKRRIGEELSGYTTTGQIREAWRRSIERLSHAGVDVEVFRQRLDGIGNEFFARAGGGMQQENYVGLVVSDLLFPSQNDLTASLHETVHFLFGLEPPEMQARIHKAIDRLSDSALGIENTSDSRISTGNPAGLDPESLAEERLAESLALEGFDVSESFSFARAILRFLNDLYLRAAIAIQEAFFGEGHSRPELAQRYVRNRLQMFLSGDSDRMPNFLSVYGGGKPNLAKQARYFNPMDGGGWTPAFLDWSDGSIAYEDMLPSSAESAAYNIRTAKFRSPTNVASPEVLGGENQPGIRAGIDVAANNAVTEAMVEAFRSSGFPGTFEEFVSNQLNQAALPTQRIAATLSTLQQIPNAGPLPAATTRIPELRSEVYRSQASAKALRMLQQTNIDQANLRNQAEERIKRVKDSWQSKVKRLSEIEKRYKEADFMASVAAEETRSLLSDFNADWRSRENVSRKIGVITQQLKSLEQEPTLAPQYKEVIDKLGKKVMTNPGSFMDLLLEIAGMDFVDWDMPVYDWKGQPGLMTVLNGYAQNSSLMKSWGLDANNRESRAAVAFLSAFAKSNDSFMDWIAVRQSRAHEEEARLHQLMADAKQDTSRDLANTKAKVRQFGRLSRQAGRLVERYSKAKKEFTAMLDQMQEDQRFIGYSDALTPVLRNEMAKLEENVGAGRMFEPYEGAMMYVPPDIRSTIPEVEASQKAFSYNLSPANIRELQNRMKLWLDWTREHGSLWMTVADQYRKLNMLQATDKLRGVKRSVFSSIFGWQARILSDTGTPQGRALAARLRRYDANVLAHTKANMDAGIKVAKAKGDAMKAVGIRIADDFDRRFLDPAMKFLEQGKNLIWNPQGFNIAMRQLRTYLASAPASRELLQTPEAWNALERYYRARGNANKVRNQTRKEMGLKIEDSLLGGLFREPIGMAEFTFPRHLSDSMEAIWRGMSPAWNGTVTPKWTPERILELSGNPGELQKEAQARFTPEVWKRFAEPLANLPQQSAFSGLKFPDGTWSLAPSDTVRQAFRASPGPVEFAVNLYQMLGGTPGGEPEFIAETLSTFQNYFDELNRQFAEADAKGSGAFSISSLPREFMDSRISESFPAEWMKYSELDQNAAIGFVQRAAYHAAFGRDGQALYSDFDSATKTLSQLAERKIQIESEVAASNPGKSSKEIDPLVRQRILQEGENLPGGAQNYLTLLQNAQSHLDKVHQARDAISSNFSLQSENLAELRPFMTALRTVSGWMVQGPKSALSNTMSMFDPLVRLPLSRQALKYVRNNWEEFARSAWGSFLQTFTDASNYSSDALTRKLQSGIYDPLGRTTFLERWQAAYNDPLWLKFGRRAQAVTNAPLPTRTPVQNRPFPTIRPLAPFSTMQTWMDPSLVMGTWRTFDDLVARAVKHFKDNPASAADPNFTFQSKDLGYRNGFLLRDKDAFEFLKERLLEYGMSLEGLARDAITRNEGRMFTQQQDQLLATVAMSELSLNSSLSNSPEWLLRNPVLRFATPLLFWPMARMEQLRQAFRGPQGQLDRHTAMQGVKILASLLPIGLAYAWMRDEYDEELTGKKSNIRGFGTDNNFLAAVERLSSVGSFGLWGDVGNVVGNMAGEGDLKGISLDQRLVFANLMNRSLEALMTAIKQEDATYSTVWRPLMQAIGGSGYLQYAQILNNSLGLNNAEARVTARINVQNYLRSAGRELEMDVRTGRGSKAVPNPIKPWVSEMVLYAYANDAAGFERARRLAVEAAESEGKADPEETVRRSFSAYHPLRAVFQTSPSELDYRKLLGAMPEDGRADVSTAVNLFNAYGVRIGVTPFTGKSEKRASILQRPSAESLRSQRSRLMQRAFNE